MSLHRRCGPLLACGALFLLVQGRSHAAAPHTVRLDLDGHPLPPGAIARLGTLRGRLPGTVHDFALSPDGKRLAVCVHGGLTGVAVLNLATREPIRTVPCPGESSPVAVAFSPDGKTVAHSESRGPEDDGSLCVWEAETGKEVHRIGGEAFGAVAFSPDGKGLAAATGPDRRPFLWDARTGKLLRMLPGAFVERLLFSPDGKWLFTMHRSGRVSMWDLSTGKLVREFCERPGFVRKALALSADGRLLAAGENAPDALALGGVGVWEVSSGKRLHLLPGHPIHLHALAFSPDGKVLASQGDGPTIRFWDVASGKEGRRLEGRHPDADCLAFSPDGRLLVSGGSDYAVHIWEMTSGKVVWPPEGHWGEVNCLAVSPDGRTVATGSEDGTARLWCLKSGRHLRRVGSPGRPLNSVAFSPDGKALASAGGRGALLWRVDTGAQLRELQEQGRSGSGFVGFAAGGVIVGTDNYGGVWASRPAPRAARLVLREYDEGPMGLFGFGAVALLSADGKVFAYGKLSSPAQFWAFPSAKKMVARLPEGCSPLALSHDGTLLVAHEEEGAVALLEVGTGAPLRRWSDIGAPALFSTDGRALAAWDNGGGLCLVEVMTGRVRRRFQAVAATPGGAVLPPAVQFSPDSRLLVTGCGPARRGLLTSSGSTGSTTALVWDLTGHGGRLPRTRLSARELEALAADLERPDAARAYRAVWALAAAQEQAPAFLLERLRPTFRGDTGPARKWTADLGGDDFPRRERAQRGLECLGDLAEPALRQALAGRPGLEHRLRLERLLRALAYPPPTPARLLAVRSVEALEQAGTPEARQALLVIAREAPGAWLRREANGSLRRLDQRGTLGRTRGEP